MNNISENENIFKKTRRLYNEEHDYEITQEFLGKKLGKDKGNISKLEKGITNPTLEYVKLYHEIFGVTMEHLVGECEAKHYENIRVSTDLGVTDAVADTMVMLKNISSNQFNYSAVLNAFIGNKEATYNFINTMILYLKTEHQNGYNPVIDTLLTTETIKYINHFVKPQLKSVIDKMIKEEESNIDKVEKDTVAKMIQDCI